MPDQTSTDQVPNVNPSGGGQVPPVNPEMTHSPQLSIDIPAASNKKPNKGLGVVLAILFTSLLAVAGYFGYNYWQMKQQTQNTQPTEQVQTVQPETDQTANWQSYKDSKISFKYPENWQVSMTDNSLFVAPSVRFKEITGNPGVYAAKFIPIVVNFYETSAALVKTPSRAKIISQEKVNINGINSLKYFLEISEPESGFNLGDEYIKVALQDEATFLEFLLFDEQYGFVFNQILSTFRFFGQEDLGVFPSLTPTPSWRRISYRNIPGWPQYQALLDFDFQFPPDYSSPQKNLVDLQNKGEFYCSFSSTKKVGTGEDYLNFIALPKNYEDKIKRALAILNVPGYLNKEEVEVCSYPAAILDIDQYYQWYKYDQALVVETESMLLIVRWQQNETNQSWNYILESIRFGPKFNREYFEEEVNECRG